LIGELSGLSCLASGSQRLSDLIRVLLSRLESHKHRHRFEFKEETAGFPDDDLRRGEVVQPFKEFPRVQVANKDAAEQGQDRGHSEEQHTSEQDPRVELGFDAGFAEEQSFTVKCRKRLLPPFFRTFRALANDVDEGEGHQAVAGGVERFETEQMQKEHAQHEDNVHKQCRGRDEEEVSCGPDQSFLRDCVDGEDQTVEYQLPVVAILPPIRTHMQMVLSQCAKLCLLYCYLRSNLKITLPGIFAHVLAMFPKNQLRM
jgi:hypothetical protein